jgi:DNA transformation protein
MWRDASHQARQSKKRKRVAKSLAELPNIGPTIENRLNEIGVRTRADLTRLGAVDAYLRICAKFPHQTIPVCYYLYSLQGALMGLHWNDLPVRLKTDLLFKATGRKLSAVLARRSPAPRRGARTATRSHS